MSLKYNEVLCYFHLSSIFIRISSIPNLLRIAKQFPKNNHKLNFVIISIILSISLEQYIFVGSEESCYV